MDCRERLEQYLCENGVPFETMAHQQVFTMPEVAAALHVSGKQVAKTVIVKADATWAMFVIPSPQRLDLPKVRAFLDAQKISVAREDDFAGLFPDCATGAMPPFGNLYGLRVYVDVALAEQNEIVFRVGTHRHAMKVAYADYTRLVQPTEGDFALGF